MSVAERIVWEPQRGPQAALVACPLEEVFYGGARGGGKTDGILGDWLEHSSRVGTAARGVVFRRELTQLDDLIERSKAIYYGIYGTRARYREQKKTWFMPGGGVLRFRYLDKDKDAEKYQGHSYTRVYFEELTNFPSPAPVFKIMATLRPGFGPADLGFRATGNPGGPGHLWVKARYIDPSPLGWKTLSDVFTDPYTGQQRVMSRVFIPAKLHDNKILLSQDPGYVYRLQQAGTPQLVRAWLRGDWNVALGTFFPEFTQDHVVPHFEPPSHWQRYLAFDWGSAAPFCVLWIAVSDGSLSDMPRGALYVYQEWYGAEFDGNEWLGLKLHAEDVAAGIVKRCRASEYVNQQLNVAGADLFKEDGGPSFDERMRAAPNNVRFRRADTKRIPGWDQLRSRLKGDSRGPMLYVSEHCTHLVRTLAALPHDPTNIEDVDTDAEDHAPDSLRYACMARPYVKHDDKWPKTKYAYGSFEWLLQVTDTNRNRERSPYRA